MEWIMLLCKSIPGLKCIHPKKCYTFYMSLVKMLKKWLNPNLSLLSCFRGTSKSQSAVAFRRWFYKLSELRSLVNKEVPFMAVTATATQKTKDTIVTVLRLQDFVDVTQSPNKPNIAFAVHYINR